MRAEGGASASPRSHAARVGANVMLLGALGCGTRGTSHAVEVPVVPVTPPAADAGPRAQGDASRSAPEPPWASGEWFRVRVEQRGAVARSEGHTVTIDRAPFDLVITMRRARGEPDVAIATHASYRREHQDLVRGGAPLPEHLFGPGTGMAEELFDEQHRLFLNTGGHGHWYYSGPSDHRCAEARPLAIPPEGAVECRRVVETFEEALGSTAPTRVERSNLAALYFIFASQAPATEAYEMPAERQRDWLTVQFR